MPGRSVADAQRSGSSASWACPASLVLLLDRSSDLTAMVTGIGTLKSTGFGDLTWAEHGARIGYKLTDTVTFDVFADGVSGDRGIDTRIHAGVALRFKF